MVLQVKAPPGDESSPRSPEKLLHVSYAGSRFTLLFHVKKVDRGFLFFQ
jgi:hypothetical protein